MRRSDLYLIIAETDFPAFRSDNSGRTDSILGHIIAACLSENEILHSGRVYLEQESGRYGCGKTSGRPGRESELIFRLFNTDEIIRALSRDGFVENHFIVGSTYSPFSSCIYRKDRTDIIVAAVRNRSFVNEPFPVMEINCGGIGINLIVYFQLCSVGKKYVICASGFSYGIYDLSLDDSMHRRDICVDFRYFSGKVLRFRHLCKCLCARNH